MFLVILDHLLVLKIIEWGQRSFARCCILDSNRSAFLDTPRKSRSDIALVV